MLNFQNSPSFIQRARQLLGVLARLILLAGVLNIGLGASMIITKLPGPSQNREAKLEDAAILTHLELFGGLFHLHNSMVEEEEVRGDFTFIAQLTSEARDGLISFSLNFYPGDSTRGTFFTGLYNNLQAYSLGNSDPTGTLFRPLQSEVQWVTGLDFTSKPTLFSRVLLLNNILPPDPFPGLPDKPPTP